LPSVLPPNLTMTKSPLTSHPAQYERMWARGSKAFSILALTHPTAVLIFGASVLVLAILAERDLPDARVAISLGLSMACGQSAIGLVNEIVDYELDKVAKPWRALPAGHISRWNASLLAIGCLLLALLFSSSISAPSTLGLAAGIGLGVLYSLWLKRTFCSWAPYALAYPSLPVWVWLSVDKPVLPLLPVYLIALPLAVSIHMVNQLRDYDQDSEMGIRGFVQHLGKSRAVSMCFGLLLLCPLPILLSPPSINSGPSSFLLITAASLHWLLIVPPILRYQRTHGDAAFRDMFRRLQVSGPILLLAWVCVSG
jgi:4-hydroxybenzoate polyprenyltransferase